MRETISSKNGLSPPCRSADLSQSHSYMSIYTFTPLWIFFFSNREQFVQHTVKKAAFLLPPALLSLCLLLLLLSLCLYSHPPSLAVSSLSIPFPQLFPALCLPPSLRLIRLYAARHKFIGGKGRQQRRSGDRGGLKRRDGSD